MLVTMRPSQPCRSCSHHSRPSAPHRSADLSSLPVRSPFPAHRRTPRSESPSSWPPHLCALCVHFGLCDLCVEGFSPRPSFHLPPRPSGLQHLTSALSVTSALFCATQKVKSFTIYNFRTLLQKPGCRVLPLNLLFSFNGLCTLAFSQIRFLPSTHSVWAFGRTLHTSARSRTYERNPHTSPRSTCGTETASYADVVFHAPTRAFACRFLPRECRKISPFQGSHAK